MPRGVLIESGKLNKRVTIKTPPSATASQNAYGEPTGSPATLATRWAAIESLSGGEGYEANQVIAKVTHKITLRYLSGVTPGCLVEFGGRTLHVGYVNDELAEKWKMELIVGEKVNP